MQLLDGRPRPEVLLEHTRFYRHFGLKVRGHGEDNELPDHLCCQLEAMAWLGELEARTRREAKPTEGLERAQADFLDKLLIPFLDQFVPTLELELSRRGGDPLFAALGGAAASIATWHAHEVGAAVQFALKAADVTPYLMGVAGAPVNIWYWKADDDSADNLAAGGPGSTSRSARPAPTARRRSPPRTSGWW